MAKVTYRGVIYDTEARKARETQALKVKEVYRGIRHDEEVKRPQ